MPKSKTYVCNVDGRISGVVLAASQKKAAEALGVSLYRLKEFGSETANQDQIKVAARQPGKAFYFSNNDFSAKRKYFDLYTNALAARYEEEKNRG